jgi:hypothetical protein
LQILRRECVLCIYNSGNLVCTIFLIIKGLFYVKVNPKKKGSLWNRNLTEVIQTKNGFDQSHILLGLA